MRTVGARSSAALAATALLLVISPAFARGGGGRGGGGGHSSGGHSSGGFSSSHSSGSYGSSGSHYSGSSGSSGRSYSSPHYSSSPSYGHSSSGTHYAAPRSYSSGSPGGTHYAPSHGSTVYGRSYNPGVASTSGAHVYGRSVSRAPVIAGGGRGGYVGGGRGYYAAGGRVPVFVGRRGYYGSGVWWGPQYGWRVPVYWGGYYTPYPAYWGVGYWVTDWVMLDYLALEEARMLAYERSGSYVVVPRESTALPTDVREELRQQIDQYIAEPTPDVPASAAPGNTLVVNDPRVARALGAPHHVFVVSHPVAVTDRTNGGTCNLTHADLLRTSSPVPSGQAWADATVAASKTSSCPAGAVVAVPVAELVRFEGDLLDRVTRGAAAARAADNDPGTAAAPTGRVTTQSGQAPAPDAAPEGAPQRLPSADDMPSTVPESGPEADGEQSL